MIVFHASPNPSIKKLYDNSYVTIFPHIAYYMGLFHKNTGKTWTDDDLQIPYGFEEIIKFKKGRKPLGKPTLYYCDIDPSNIIIHQNFPFEFQVKKGCKVKIVNINDVSLLLRKSKRLSRLFDEVCFSN